MRKIETTLDNILQLVSIAWDYGFYKPILMEAFAEMIGTLSDDEIETYARSVGDDKGYTDEDYESVKECLIEFRKDYMS